MNIIACKVGQKARFDYMHNHLLAFQSFVGGKIETVSSPTGFVIVCNSEGLLKKLPKNPVVDSMTATLWRWPETIRGDYLICGVNGDSFTDIPEGDLTDELLVILNSER